MSFTIKRGTNISHWLSQSRRRGAERAAFFTQDDVQHIADLGFDHIRLPIDEEQMWNEQGRAENEAFDLLEAALNWCQTANLRVVVDLHILRSHYFNDRATPRLFTDPAEAERLADLWRDLSARLGRRSTDRVAYEMLNEAVAPDPADWNRVALHTFAAIRQREPQRTIVLGSNQFNQCHTYDELEIPDDKFCILTFHFYHPMLITHHQAGWWGGGFWAGPVQYPGVPLSDEHLTLLNPDFLAHVGGWSNAPYDRAAMIRDMQPPLRARQRSGLPLYCGEFGVYIKTPRPARLAWYRDIMQTFQEYDIAWANWDYKGGFGPVVQNGQDADIVDILLH